MAKKTTKLWQGRGRKKAAQQAPGYDAAAAASIGASPSGTTMRANLLTAAIVMAGLTVAAVGLHLLSSIAGPAFFALTLMVSARPIQKWLTKHHVPAMLSALIVLIGLYIILLFVLVAVAASLAQAALELPKYAGAFQSIYSQVIDWLETLGVDESAVAGVLQNVDLNRVADIAATVLSKTSSVGGQVLILLVVMFFLAIDSTKVHARWVVLNKARPELAEALDGFVAGVRKYWVVTTIFGLIVAALDVVALWVIGVPLAMVWGLLAFVTNYIPNVGFVIGLVPPALLGLLNGGVSDMVWVIVAYCFLNFTIQVIIQPKVTGEAVGLSPVVSFLSLTFWTLVIGPLGAILAIPLTLAAKTVLVDAHPEARWINTFLVTDEDASRLEPKVPAVKPLKL